VLMFCFALTGDPYNGSPRASQAGVHSRDRLHTHAYRGRTEYEVAVVRVHWSFVFAETSAINISTHTCVNNSLESPLGIAHTSCIFK
jgi:hypothetical protein